LFTCPIGCAILSKNQQFPDQNESSSRNIAFFTETTTFALLPVGEKYDIVSIAPRWQFYLMSGMANIKLHLAVSLVDLIFFGMNILSLVHTGVNMSR
jgi:hypothetical protein